MLFLFSYFKSLVAIVGTYCFCPVCLLVCLFVCWITLTLVISFEPFQIEPSYLACRFLVTRASSQGHVQVSQAYLVFCIVWCNFNYTLVYFCAKYADGTFIFHLMHVDNNPSVSTMSSSEL